MSSLLTRPKSAGRPLRAVEELELKWINLAMPGDVELRILSAIVEFALEGSIKHAEFLFNRKYGMPSQRIAQQTESRVLVVYGDPDLPDDYADAAYTDTEVGLGIDADDDDTEATDD